MSIEPNAAADADASVWETIDAFIEIPMGSRNKYELDPATGQIRLDRVLYSAVHYPTDYGFIPETLGEDGDTLDILVLTYHATFPGCVVETRPIGGLDMADDKGGDFKVIAVPVVDPRFNGVTSLEHLESHWLLEIETFFATYKLLERKHTDVRGWHGVAVAHAEIEACRERYRQTQQATASTQE